MEEYELTNKMEILAGLMTAMEEEKAAFEARTKDTADLIESIKTELKAEFLSRKDGFTSDHLVVSYRKGAVRWDSAGLKAYAKTHPELKEFQKVGDPTVAFSLRKEEERENKDTLMTMEGGEPCRA